MRCCLTILFVTSSAFVAGEPFEHPFFPFKNSMESGGPESVAEQVAILDEIGFDGFDNRNLADLEGTVKALDAKGMKLFSSYFTVNIDPGEEPWRPDLPALLPLLKDRGTVLWCNTHSKRFQASDPAGDEFAVPLFQQLADLVAPYGVRVAPYPHTGLWVESPEDTARLADKVDRPNFGTSFNLYHWKNMRDRKQPLEEVVKRLIPHLMLISINGDVGPQNIGPLEEENLLEYCAVLEAFHDAGYRGPVGLQCYKIPGDPRVHLGQSFKVWKQIVERLSKQEP